MVAPMPTAAGALYTCPMHPQVQQRGPGDCPICGMAGSAFLMLFV
jgi:Cu+-exporting ATPase